MRKLLTITFVALVGAFILINCNDTKKRVERRQMNGYTIEAHFKDDSIVEGVAKFYQKDGRLVSITNYSDGKKDGVAMNYHSNGERSDSMNFSCGFKNGFQYRYDSLGQLYSIGFEYFDLRMGPQVFLDKGIVNRYFYLDFNKEDLIGCSYDSLGQITEVNFFLTKPKITQVEVDDRKMVELFFYLPNPPNAQITYDVGVTNGGHEDRRLFSVNKSSIIFDTILPRSEEGQYYYVSAHIKNVSGSVNKLFIEEVH